MEQMIREHILGQRTFLRVMHTVHLLHGTRWTIYRTLPNSMANDLLVKQCCINSIFQYRWLYFLSSTMRNTPTCGRLRLRSDVDFLTFSDRAKTSCGLAQNTFYLIYVINIEN